MWIRSDKSLPQISIKFPGEGRSIRVLVWHSPTERPFVGQLVENESGQEYFIDDQLWWIEIEHCPFWMFIPFTPTSNQYF